MRARAALRRWLAVLTTVMVLPLLLSATSPLTPVAQALTQTGDLWTVAPGAAAEIQSAIDAARDNGGGRVRLPAGVYSLTSKIRLHSNVTVYGDGMDQTILRWATAGAPDHMMSNSTLTAGNSNIQVWGLTLDGQGKPSPDPDACCFGLRLNNVRNSVVVNVAADSHSLDGIYMGYNRSNGAVNVRLSGCRANNNSRNGISLIHGDANVIDGCQVNSNNRGEAVAGIDVEPDEGMSVTNSKIVGNVANGQNVGIQIFLPWNGFATTYHNAVCYNTTSGNVSAGVYSHRGDQNIFVGNNTSGNGTDYLVDDSSLEGPGYAGWCALGALPPHPSTLDVPKATATPTLSPTTTPTPLPTFTPTPRPSCSPRPPVGVVTQRGQEGSLHVTVSATRSAAAPNNSIWQIEFGKAENATLDVGGQPRGAGNFTATMPASVERVTFVVRRGTFTSAATTVPFTVTDDCGEWKSFVGGGANAF